jgi:preprotein translocase subunit YajC
MAVGETINYKTDRISLCGVITKVAANYIEINVGSNNIIKINI